MPPDLRDALSAGLESVARARVTNKDRTVGLERSEVGHAGVALALMPSGDLDGKRTFAVSLVGAGAAVLVEALVTLPVTVHDDDAQPPGGLHARRLLHQWAVATLGQDDAMPRGIRIAQGRAGVAWLGPHRLSSEIAVSLLVNSP